MMAPEAFEEEAPASVGPNSVRSAANDGIGGYPQLGTSEVSPDLVSCSGTGARANGGAVGSFIFK